MSPPTARNILDDLELLDAEAIAGIEETSYVVPLARQNQGFHAPTTQAMSNNIQTDVTPIYHVGDWRVYAVGDEVTIGRGDEADIAINDHSVSRVHLRLDVAGGRVVDLGSTNGTFVDGERLAPHQPHPIVHGQSLMVGSIPLLFVDAANIRRLLKSLRVLGG